MGQFLYRLGRWMFRQLQRPCGGVEAIGLERFPADGPVIVAVNHASFLDPIMAGLSCRRPLHFMARRTLFSSPVFGPLLRAVNAFPLDRDGDPRAALRACGAQLEKGGAVLLFPEGTRSRDGRLGPMKGGAGMMATRYRAPVLPVYLWGTYQSWPRGRAIPKPHPVRVYYGHPIPWDDGRKGGREAQQRINDAVRDALSALEQAARERARPSG